MARYDLVIFDLDGTLWRGDSPIDGVAEAVKQIQDLGIRTTFLTNNATLTAQMMVDKLTKLGFKAGIDEVMSSSMGLAKLLRDNDITSTFAVGEPGMSENLRQGGIKLTDWVVAESVCIGLCRQFNYQMLEQAQQVLLRGGFFAATNTDATFPLEGGKFAPGAGSLVAALATAGCKQPVVVGKPEPTLINQIIAQFETDSARTLVVGDRLDTDIESGRRASCDTYLVLTGVETRLPEGQLGGNSVIDLSAWLANPSE